MNTQKVKKVLAQYGICSRRTADFLIRDKTVLINGLRGKIRMKDQADLDTIKINGDKLKSLRINPKFILLNKLKNPITIVSDNQNTAIIMGLFTKKYKKWFFTVGRLNFENISLGNLNEVLWKIFNIIKNI